MNMPITHIINVPITHFIYQSIVNQSLFEWLQCEIMRINGSNAWLVGDAWFYCFTRRIKTDEIL